MKQKLVLIVIILMMFLVGCEKKVDVNDVKSKYVKIHKIEAIENSETRIFPGVVKERKESKLSFMVSGPIEAICVHEGEKVSAGDVVAKMDKRDYNRQLSGIKALYEQAEKEVNRIKTLWEKGDVATNSYEKAVAKLEAAKAKYDHAKDQVKDTYIKAPYSGYIQELYYEEGEIAKAGFPVLSMISNSKYEVICDLPATIVANKDRLLSYECAIETQDNETFALSLKSLRMKANMNALYRATFDLHISKSRRVVPGMDCEVLIKMSVEDKKIASLLAIPAHSILQENDKNYVWVCRTDAENNYHVYKTEIEIDGLDAEGRVRVSSGLSSGDKIVEAGVYHLTDGQIVFPIKYKTKTNYGGIL